MKKRLGFFLYTVLMSVLLTGCANYRRGFVEGGTSCVIALQSIPQELVLLDEQTVEDIKIKGMITDPVSKKYYDFELTSENEYMQEIALNEGSYEVSTFFTVTPSYYDIEVASYQLVLEVGADKTNFVGIYITNVEELARQVEDRTASAEILASGDFSRKVQWHGQVIDIARITDYVDFEYSDKVVAFGEVSIDNAKENVLIVVQNETEQPANWQDCTIKAVSFGGSNVVMSGGVVVGMAYKDVVHGESGIYGTPDSMGGSILLGTSLQPSYAYYSDAASGDKITVVSDIAGEFVEQVRYDLAVYE